MGKLLRYTVLTVISIALTSCASTPVVYEFSPPEDEGEHLSIRPWLGEQAFLLELENTSDSTVEILTDSLVLVSPTGMARDLETTFRATAIPPGSGTYAIIRGPVRFDIDPEDLIRRLSSAGVAQSSGFPETQTQLLERMKSHRGESVRLCITYTVEGTRYEQIAQYEIADARSLERRQFQTSRFGN